EACEDTLDLVARELEVVLVDRVCPHDVACARAPPHQHGALGDPAGAERVEVGGPVVERGAHLLDVAGVALVPAGRVVERVGPAEAEHPDVAAVSLEPLVPTLVGLVLARGASAAGHRRVTAGLEVLRRLSHDALRELVAGQPRIAVLPAALR